MKNVIYILLLLLIILLLLVVVIYDNSQEYIDKIKNVQTSGQEKQVFLELHSECLKGNIDYVLNFYDNNDCEIKYFDSNFWSVVKYVEFNIVGYSEYKHTIIDINNLEILMRE